MQAKEYLQQLKRMDTAITLKIKEADTLRARSESMGGRDYSKERVQSSHSTDAPYVKTLTRVIDLEQEIDQEIDRLSAKRHEIITQIQGLKNSKHIELLYKRYVEFKRFDLIAKEMRYTYSYIRALHRHSLQEFERAYKIAQNSTK